ncbi:MAG: dihydropteroate synthase [Campylobacterales bacterium]|nr:dihydropteroate synthase [Campylobacterales bacterium]
MNIYRISNDTDVKTIFKKLDVCSGGISIMSDKSELFLFYIKDIKTPAANILKQDALSIGAEFAVPNGVIECKSEFVDGVLICNKKHIKILAKKELAQPFGLKSLAHELKNFIDEESFDISIMGVLNANSDSFYEDSRFKPNETISKIEQMIADGADIIDIGAISSRPGSLEVSEDEEFLRLKSVIDTIYSQKLYEKVEFSLDSYSYKCLEYALDRGFKIVNDITGLKNENIAKLASKFCATVVIMHMQNNPSNMQLNPTYDNVMIDIDNFFKQRVEMAKSFGVQNIILDVGIGFGKNLEHNLTLIKNLAHFKKFQIPLLIGASRKSMIDKITPSDIKDRLAGTLAIHLKSLDNGASIIRCHDVKEHYQAIKVWKAIKNSF